MKRRGITIEEAKEVWGKVKDNEFTLVFYPTFEDYWKECERINSLPDDKWHKLIEENQKKLKSLTPPI